MRKYIIIAARVILIAAIIVWMMTIFGFSADEAEVSQSKSDIITEKVIEAIVKYYDDMTLEKQKDVWDAVSFYVRKTGHFGEYGILSVLIFLFLITFESVRNRHLWLLSDVAVCVVYAITDEVHQGFVDGRSPKIMDVIIDTSGAFVGLMFAFIIWHFVVMRMLKDKK